MKTDARVRYTKMRIREAFFVCLARKPVRRITVKELCDLAEINRATFYKHYMDVFDLLEKLEEEALEELRQEIVECRRNAGKRILLTILSSIQNGDNTYAALASQNGDPNFAARIWALFYREYQPRMAKNLPGRTEEERKAAYLFLTGGCGNLLSAWIRGGMCTPAEEMAKVLEEMSGAFVKGYQREEY